MAEIPSAGHAAQRGENPRKNLFLNYKSADDPELRPSVLDRRRLVHNESHQRYIGF